mgnify:CR=1 FL=1
MKAKIYWKDEKILSLVGANEIIFIEFLNFDEDSSKTLDLKKFSVHNFVDTIKCFAFSERYSIIFVAFENSKIQILN